jgi:hypothetical protein
MKVGAATVYIEQIGESVIETDDRIRPVAPPTPQEVFETAGDVLSECVRIVGERIEALAEKAMPKKVNVEFSISFKVVGKTSLVPIFVTGETGAETGLKVTAEWERSEKKETPGNDNSNT